MKLSLMSVREREGRFFFEDHLEQAADWNDILMVDILPASADSKPRTWAAWNTGISTAIRNWQPTDADLVDDRDPAAGRWYGEIPVPEVARELLGERARVAMTVSGREA